MSDRKRLSYAPVVPFVLLAVMFAINTATLVLNDGPALAIWLGVAGFAFNCYAAGHTYGWRSTVNDLFYRRQR